ncbi:hypothetical protein OXX80_006710 [Metschnikowia pulcherrima]
MRRGCDIGDVFMRQSARSIYRSSTLSQYQPYSTKHHAKIQQKLPERKKLRSNEKSGSAGQSKGDDTRHKSRSKHQKHTNSASMHSSLRQPEARISKEVMEARRRTARYNSLKVIIAAEQNMREAHSVDTKTSSIQNLNNSCSEAKSSQNSHSYTQKEATSRIYESRIPTVSRESAMSYKLRQDALTKYLTKVCKNMMVEEKSGADPKTVLTSKDFSLIWLEEPDKESRSYSIQVPLSRELLDRFLSKNMQRVGKTPIYKGQTLMLFTKKKEWYGTVTSAEVDEGIAPLPKLLKIHVELFDFNSDALPAGSDVSQLEILPASTTVSRLFQALSRLERSHFLDVILGRKLTPRGVVPSSKTLTSEQAGNSEIIQSILSNPVTTIHRPASVESSEKTSEVVKELLKNGLYPIFVVSASNQKLDEIAERMIPDHQDFLLRIVAQQNEYRYTKANTISPICLHNIVYKEMPSRIKQLISKFKTKNRFLSEEQFKHMKKAQIPVINRLISERRVIFSTPVGVGGIYFREYDQKPIVVMDDASHTSEATTLIPLLLNGVSRFVQISEKHISGSFSQVPDMSFSHLKSILNGT